MTATRLVPDWLVIWYVVNFLVNGIEWVYMILRPRSAKGGDLAFLFPIFNYYATKDKVYANHHDKTVQFIYALSPVDLIAVAYLLVWFSSCAHQPSFALLCIYREVFVATKTSIYLMYSYQHIVPSWRLFVTIMNGQWIIIPVFVVAIIHKQLVDIFSSTVVNASFGH